MSDTAVQDAQGTAQDAQEGGSRRRRQSKAKAFQVLAFLKEQGGPVEEFLLFKKFKVGRREMRRIIFDNQNKGIWISGVETPPGSDDLLYTYMGEDESIPIDYPGPIRRSRSSS